jgi:hypothetical protein
MSLSISRNKLKNKGHVHKRHIIRVGSIWYLTSQPCQIKRYITDVITENVDYIEYMKLEKFTIFRLLSVAVISLLVKHEVKTDRKRRYMEVYRMLLSVTMAQSIVVALMGKAEKFIEDKSGNNDVTYWNGARTTSISSLYSPQHSWVLWPIT